MMTVEQQKDMYKLVAERLTGKNRTTVENILSVLDFMVRNFSDDTEAYAIVLSQSRKIGPDTAITTVQKSSATPATINRNMLARIAYNAILNAEVSVIDGEAAENHSAVGNGYRTIRAMKDKG
jgi:hypothetical protein